jgi:hypothetical protein
MPNKKSSAIVTHADSSSDPRQPNRFEKKKNILQYQPLTVALPSGPGFWPEDVAAVIVGRRDRNGRRDRRGSVQDRMRIITAVNDLRCS